MYIIKELLITVILCITSVFKDLYSFRNKLTVFVCAFSVACVLVNPHNTAVVLAAIAFLDAYLVYYLHNRKKKDPKN